MQNTETSLPDVITNHLRKLISDAQLPANDEFFHEITKNWLSKNSMFIEQTSALDMSETKKMELDDPRGAIICTHSGSLLSLGSLKNNSRWLEYTSISLRNDVPDIIKIEDAKISEPIEAGKPLLLEHESFKRTSPVYQIMQCDSSVPLVEQEKRIREATIFLTNGFMKLNNTLSIYNDDIEHFTMKSMLRYLANKNDLPQNTTKQLIDDFIDLIESGMLLGEKVPLGNLGKLYLKVKDAQKARVGRNPATGETMTIKAKPATSVPKISFSKYIKEKAALVKIDE